MLRLVARVLAALLVALLVAQAATDLTGPAAECQARCSSDGDDGDCGQDCQECACCRSVRSVACAKSDPRPERHISPFEPMTFEAPPSVDPQDIVHVPKQTS
jgi:hypothetical protein